MGHRLAIVVIASVALCGCAWNDYGPYTGGYYPTPYASPGYLYGVPAGSFGVGGIWTGGEHEHWHHWNDGHEHPHDGDERHNHAADWHRDRGGWQGNSHSDGWHGHVAERHHDHDHHWHD